MSPRTYEEDPQVSDYRRSPYEEDADHELTLSTPTILGLFFALVLVCGCFFGLGYAMGHRTAPATAQVFENAPLPVTNAAKPTAGSAEVTNTPASVDVAVGPPTSDSGGLSTTVTLNPTTAAVPASAPAAATIVPKPAPSPVLQPASTAPAGNFVVQVAAVSSQDVANILLSTLQKKGYAVAVHHEPQDNLLHVQIGPFADRKDADAMRQRVVADGFNAIVK